MSSRLVCWLHGHQWGDWDPRIWQNVFGAEYWVRWCEQCGARQAR